MAKNKTENTTAPATAAPTPAVLKTRNGSIDIDNLNKAYADSVSQIVDQLNRAGITKYQGIRSVTTIDRETLKAVRAGMPDSVRKRFDRAVKIATAIDNAVLAYQG